MLQCGTSQMTGDNVGDGGAEPSRDKGVIWVVLQPA